MEEVFVNLKIPNFEKYKISNYGRLLTAKGKLAKPVIKDGVLRYNALIRAGKAVLARLAGVSVAKLVYTHFSDKLPGNKDFKVFHIDGDPYNNNINNLKVAVVGVPNEEQIKIYLRSAKKVVLYRLKQLGIFEKQKHGLDIDNIIGESLFLIYYYLPKYTNEYSFYGFCKKYVDIAIKREIKHFSYESTLPIY